MRLNAILPPRAVELRYLSFSEPELLTVRRNTPYTPPAAVVVTNDSTNSTATTQEPTEAPTATAAMSLSDWPSSRPSSAPSFRTSAFNADGNIESVVAGTAEAPSRRRRLFGETETALDPELDRHPRSPREGDGSDLLAGDGDGTGSAESSGNDTAAAPSDGAAAVSEGEVAEYYGNIMACMEGEPCLTLLCNSSCSDSFSCVCAEYQLEDFTDALKSCMSESVGFVHISGQQYYRIRHRYPFIFVYDYLEVIPDPAVSGVHGADRVDLAIIAFVLAVALAGLVASVIKLKLFEFFCSDDELQPGSPRGTRRKMQSLTEDGFVQAEETTGVSRMVGRVWGALGGSSPYAAYSTVRTSSDEDLTDLLSFSVDHSCAAETVLSPKQNSFLPRVRDRGYNDLFGVDSDGGGDVEMTTGDAHANSSNAAGDEENGYDLVDCRE